MLVTEILLLLLNVIDSVLNGEYSSAYNYRLKRYVFLNDYFTYPVYLVNKDRAAVLKEDSCLEKLKLWNYP